MLKTLGFFSLTSLALSPSWTTDRFEWCWSGPTSRSLLQTFLPRIYTDSNSNVEYSGAIRGQFAMTRGVRQGYPPSRHLFTMACDPVYRWLMSAALPLDRHRPWFLQRCACAYAEDFALATASVRDALSTVAFAFETINTVTGMSLNHKMCNWIQYGNVTTPQLSDWVGTNFPAFRLMLIGNHARYLGIDFPPDVADHRWTKPSIKFVSFCARIRSSSQSLVRRLVSFKIFELSVL